MSVEILSEHSNPLLGRKEAKLLVHHQGAGTPDRLIVRKLGSDHFKVAQEKIYVRSIHTRTGGSSAICQVEIYDDSKLAEKIVPGYVRNRNLPREQRVSRKKTTEEKTPSPPPPPKPATPEKKAETPKPAPPKEAKPATAETKPTAKPEAKPAAKPPAGKEGKVKP